MISVEDVRHELEQRTATGVSLGRFVALLHHWAKRNCPEYDACKRKSEVGYPYLTEDEAQAFLNWASALDKQSFQSQAIPALWQRTKKGRHMYNWR